MQQKIPNSRYSIMHNVTRMNVLLSRKKKKKKVGKQNHKFESELLKYVSIKILRITRKTIYWFFFFFNDS